MSNPASGNFDWHANRGATLSKSLVWMHSDGSYHNVLTSTGRMKIRQSYTGAVVLSLTSPTNITMGANGAVNIDCDADIMADIGHESSVMTYRYDLEIIDADGGVVRLLEGRFIVHPRISY